WLSISSLDSQRATMLFGQKIFARHQQERTQSSPLPAAGVQAIPLQESRKETLGKILRFLVLVALLSHVSVERPLVRAAKFFERFACRPRFALRGKHQAPTSGGERNRSVLSGSQRLNRAHQKPFILPKYTAMRKNSCRNSSAKRGMMASQPSSAFF